MLREFRRRKPKALPQEPSKTDQSQALDCDINHIIRRYNKTGQITHLAKSQGVYDQYTEHPPDLLSAMDVLQKAQTSFNNLPSQIRERFQNKPLEMINFLKNPKNRDEAETLGLIKSKNPPPPPPQPEPPAPKSKKLTPPPEE